MTKHTADTIIERQKIFKPNSNDQRIIDEQGINWTSFCRENLKRLDNKKRTELVDYIGNRMVLIIVGLLLLSFTFMISNIFYIVVTYIASSVVITIGFISIIGRYLVERRRKQGI